MLGPSQLQVFSVDQTEWWSRWMSEKFITRNCFVWVSLQSTSLPLMRRGVALHISMADRPGEATDFNELKALFIMCWLDLPLIMFFDACCAAVFVIAIVVRLKLDSPRISNGDIHFLRGQKLATPPFTYLGPVHLALRQLLFSEITNTRVHTKASASRRWVLTRGQVSRCCH